MTVDVTTPSDREVVVTRVFDAPAQLVFDAHAKPEIVRRWMLGPPGWSMPVCEIDFRVGGAYRYVWRNDETGEEFGASGMYREIDAPTRIVQVESIDCFDGAALCTLVLTEKNGRTTLSQTMKFDSPEARDGAIATGMTDGMGMSYAALEQIIVTTAA